MTPRDAGTYRRACLGPPDAPLPACMRDQHEAEHRPRRSCGPDRRRRRADRDCRANRHALAATGHPPRQPRRSQRPKMWHRPGSPWRPSTSWRSSRARSARERARRRRSGPRRSFSGSGSRRSAMDVRLQPFEVETERARVSLAGEDESIPGFRLSRSPYGEASGPPRRCRRRLRGGYPRRRIDGKIALIERGSIPFEEKIARVTAGGCRRRDRLQQRSRPLSRSAGDRREHSVGPRSAARRG